MLSHGVILSANQRFAYYLHASRMEVLSANETFALSITIVVCAECMEFMHYTQITIACLFIRHL